MKESNIQFKDIFDKSPIGILYYDKKGKLIDSNKVALEITGIPSLEVCKGINLFDDPNLASRKEELLKEGSLKFQAPIYFDHMKNIGFNPTKQGSAFIDYNVSLTDSGFLVQIQDITNQKKMEEAYEELMEKEEKFREIFNRADDMITLAESSKDSPSKYVEVNEVGCERLGYTREEFLKLTAPDIIAPEARAGMGKNSAQIAKSGRAKFEIVHITKNGERIPVEVNLHSFKLRGKEFKLAFSRDIREGEKS